MRILIALLLLIPVYGRKAVASDSYGFYGGVAFSCAEGHYALALADDNFRLPAVSEKVSGCMPGIKFGYERSIHGTSFSTGVFAQYDAGGGGYSNTSDLFLHRDAGVPELRSDVDRMLTIGVGGYYTPPGAQRVTLGIEGGVVGGHGSLSGCAQVKASGAFLETYCDSTKGYTAGWFAGLRATYAFTDRGAKGPRVAGTLRRYSFTGNLGEECIESYCFDSNLDLTPIVFGVAFEIPLGW